jgi:predicted Rossmann fold flavoprotein
VAGGGAAGFFAAIAVKENFPDHEVVIFEKTKAVLSKVKISGGGRCNVTNGCTSPEELSRAYPRGGNSMKKALQVFGTKQAMEWFESRGVPLVIQGDNCVFPASQDSQDVIDCFLRQTKKLSIRIETEAGVKDVRASGGRLVVDFTGEEIPSREFDRVIVATGGSPKRAGLEWLAGLGHKIENPVPSLFTFNMPEEPVAGLMGIVVENTCVGIQGTKLRCEGPLLVTHWGMSGPVVLKLSAHGARLLHEKKYDFNIQVNWVNIQDNSEVLEKLVRIAGEHSGRILYNFRPFDLPERLWLFLLEKSGLSEKKRWGELGKKGLNKLVSVLTNDVYHVKGQTSFREEFVTCGGVSLSSIDFKTMQSRVLKNLYFAGEVMDIDGITGGYNFQAAWTTGFIAGKLNS